MIPQLFRRKSTGNSQGKPLISRTEYELLLTRLDRFESEQKLIRNEWNDVYDKIAHLYDRTRKRVLALKKAEDSSEATNGKESTPDPTQPQTHAEIMQMARQKGMVR